MVEEHRSTIPSILRTSTEEEEERMQELSALRWGDGKSQTEAEERAALVCNGMGSPGLSRSS